MDFHQICEAFKKECPGYHLCGHTYNKGYEKGLSVTVVVVYDVDCDFFEVVSSRTFRSVPDIVPWLEAVKPLCTKDRLLAAYKKQLNNIITGNTVHDSNGFVSNEFARKQWLHKHIAELENN